KGDQGSTGLVVHRNGTHQVYALVHQLLRRQRAARLAGQPVDDGSHAWVTHIAEFLRNEVNALDERAAVNPLQALMPALDRGRLQQALTHVEGLVRQLMRPERRRPVAAGQAYGADEEFDGSLHT